jgi:hypothetical protein
VSRSSSAIVMIMPPETARIPIVEHNKISSSGRAKSTLVIFAFRDGEGGLFVGLDTTRTIDGVPISRSKCY